MADAALEFLLDNLKQLLIHQVNLLQGAKTQVENLEIDLRLFRAFLKDSIKKRKKNEMLQMFVREIRDLVYEAEDAIDAFVTQASEKKTMNYFKRAFYDPRKLFDVAKKVNKMAQQVKNMYERKVFDLAALNIGDEIEEDKVPEVKKNPLVREDNIVGFEDEAETLMKYLSEGTERLDVISIIGMPGLGKTTLAGKIFRDPKIHFEFPTRIWVFVSQEYHKKEVFLSILSNLANITDDMILKNDQEIARILCKKLEKGKFLIVMDDVWTPEAWTDLEEAFPKGNSRCKILITSRDERVARQANRDREPHKLRFLTPKESWDLLQLEVFGKRECPSELETTGKLIVEQCDGLPLAIVVIGGILVKRASTGNMSARKKAWEKVEESVSRYINEDSEKRVENIISLSYDKLPFYLRPCYLYLGMFPEDFEIPVRRLTLMWIAEGFIQKKNGVTMEETALDYLEELINRNLVMVEKVSPNGKIKTCRIHDILRDFCKNVAGNLGENFFQEIKRSNAGNFEPSASEVSKCRRLCIHSNVVSFISEKPFGPCVRSFTCFSKEETTLMSGNISDIPAAFKLLRVLEANSLKFTRFPVDIKQLVHLRYIVLSSNFTILPDLITKLWNLQTLMVDTTSRTLDVRADIWKMVQLRHLKTNASTTLVKPGKGKEGEKLQTLGAISPESCIESVFGRARGLTKLGIRGQIATLLVSKGLETLGNLEKLKLVNDVFPKPPSEGKLPGLPPTYKFPPKLRSLTLSATFLEWRHMSILGMLDSLEVLKLKDSAFMGKKWEAVGGGFRHLEHLHIEKTDLVVWQASDHHFPILRCLVLRNCGKLDEVPPGLAESLQNLYLKRVSKSAVDSAKRIELKKKEKQVDGASTICGFKLDIAPEDRQEN